MAFADGRQPWPTPSRLSDTLRRRRRWTCLRPLEQLAQAHNREGVRNGRHSLTKSQRLRLVLSTLLVGRLVCEVFGHGAALNAGRELTADRRCLPVFSGLSCSIALLRPASEPGKKNPPPPISSAASRRRLELTRGVDRVFHLCLPRSIGRQSEPLSAHSVRSEQQQADPHSEKKSKQKLFLPGFLS